jgi:predicted kinase
LSSVVHMLIGLPASGKSTYVEKHAPKDAIIVSPDRIRQEVFQVVYDPVVEDGVWGRFFKEIEEGLRQKKEVIIDNTNVTRRARSAIIQLAKKYEAPVIGYWFQVPLEECLKRNKQRDRVVPEYMIHSFQRMFEEPKMEEGFKEIKLITFEKKEKNEKKEKHEKKEKSKQRNKS